MDTSGEERGLEPPVRTLAEGKTEEKVPGKAPVLSRGSAAGRGVGCLSKPCAGRPRWGALDDGAVPSPSRCRGSSPVYQRPFQLDPAGTCDGNPEQQNSRMRAGMARDVITILSITARTHDLHAGRARVICSFQASCRCCPVSSPHSPAQHG